MMMKKVKKPVSLLMCLVLMLCCTVLSFANETADLQAQPLRFSKDGTLNIMHITDCHLDSNNADASVAFIALACDREQPDVIVLTGDIAMSEDYLSCIDKLMKVFEVRNIPVAVTFGNHDSENKPYTREQLMAVYNSYPNSISVDDSDSLPGCGTYYIPVLASDSDEIKFNLWMFDSGDYDSEGHYANVSQEQVQWYANQSLALEKATGHKVYSLAFQHIIVPEIYEALSSSDVPGAYKYEHMYPNGKYYYFNPQMENSGFLHETPCCGYYNHGQFNAMVERGDVLGIFTGHDHTNAFSVKYKGIQITNSLSTRYNGDAYSTQYGYRIITVSESNTDTYQTRVVHWYDFFTLADVSAAKANGENDTAKAISSCMLQGAFQRFFQRFAVTVVKIFTFRTVMYD